MFSDSVNKSATILCWVLFHATGVPLAEMNCYVVTALLLCNEPNRRRHKLVIRRTLDMIGKLALGSWYQRDICIPFLLFICAVWSGREDFEATLRQKKQYAVSDVRLCKEAHRPVVGIHFVEFSSVAVI